MREPIRRKSVWQQVHIAPVKGERKAVDETRFCPAHQSVDTHNGNIEGNFPRRYDKAAIGIIPKYLKADHCLTSLPWRKSKSRAIHSKNAARTRETRSPMDLYCLRKRFGGDHTDTKNKFVRDSASSVFFPSLLVEFVYETGALHLLRFPPLVSDGQRTLTSAPARP